MARRPETCRLACGKKLTGFGLYTCGLGYRKEVAFFSFGASTMTAVAVCAINRGDHREVRFVVSHAGRIEIVRARNHAVQNRTTGTVLFFSRVAAHRADNPEGDRETRLFFLIKSGRQKKRVSEGCGRSPTHRPRRVAVFWKGKMGDQRPSDAGKRKSLDRAINRANNRAIIGTTNRDTANPRT